MLTFNKSELKALSSLFTNFSAVFMASLIVPILTGNFDVTKLPVVLLGLALTIGTAFIAILFAKKGKL